MKRFFIIATTVFGLTSQVFAGSTNSLSNLSAKKDNDTLGAVNVLGQDDVLRAMKTVKSGKVYSLAHTTAQDTPTGAPRKYSINVDKFSIPMDTDREVTYLDDDIKAHQGLGTTMDGLGHFGINSRYYNGVHANA